MVQIVSSSQERVAEGNHVTLTCNTTCNLPDSPSFIWSKDGRPVEKKQIINNQLQLHSVSYEDEGSYTCAVRGHEGLPSPPMKINVMWEACVFPFHYKGNTYSDCTTKDGPALWCATTQKYVRGKWRYCEEMGPV
ncbi:B-cell receptor CD22-like [Sardina pilchardus]|uniref:B-cell receptor CD22-like n=1 Tax=Sardina pilchardus TaxID=27697 RepID=UPI002E1655FF